MSMLLATAVELEAVVDMDTARAWAGVTEQAWDAFQEDAGTVENLRVLAAFPAHQIQQITERIIKVMSKEILSDSNAQPPNLAAPVQRAALTSAERVQVELLYRLAKPKYGLQDEDPFGSHCYGTCGACSAWCNGKATSRRPQED